MKEMKRRIHLPIIQYRQNVFLCVYECPDMRYRSQGTSLTAVASRLTSGNEGLGR